MLSGLAELVVQGMTMDGQVFQPEDWAEQLCATIANAGKGRNVPYANYLHAEVVGGIRSLVVRSVLKEVDPIAFDTIKQFVARNHLMVRAGRGAINAEASGPFQAVTGERRDSKRNDW